MHTHSKETQMTVTPDLALEILKEGNERFMKNLKANRNLLQQVNETSKGINEFLCLNAIIENPFYSFKNH